MIHEKTLIVDGITPVGAYAAFRADAGRASFLLESVVPGERWGRYSILGYRPRTVRTLLAKPGVDPFAELSTLLPQTGARLSSAIARFSTAHVGAVCYDLVHYAHKVPPWPQTRLPLALFASDATVIVFDNLEHTATIVAPDAAELAQAEAQLRALPVLSPLSPPDPGGAPASVSVNVSDAEYCSAVERAREHIYAGDAFQIVPARTFSVPSQDADPFDVYRALRVLSPAPYMYLLEFAESDEMPPLAIVGASPETLVRSEGGQVTLRPIAGTRRRGRTPEEDEALAQEMMADPKEVAEHVMLIDLARNDVGRIARTGSVELVKRMQVERFSHVMHIVSEVRGTLREDVGPLDVLRATFPAGTLTGAPKVRAMQIIRELEQRPRGIYGGAVGYVTRDGELDFAIAIRTAVYDGSTFEITAGAGVVADSVPELEAKETRNKARAMLAAVAAAQRARR